MTLLILILVTVLISTLHAYTNSRFSFRLLNQRLKLHNSVMMRSRQVSRLQAELQDFNKQSLEEQNDPDNDLPDDAFGASVGPLPTVSSRVNWEDVVVDETQLCDLWIVGCGTLGLLAAQQYKQANPTASVIGETATTKNHEELKKMQIFPRLREERDDDMMRVARNIIVCIPPSAAFNNEAYEQELCAAYQAWAGPEYGNLVYTSSTAVYGDSYGNIVDEDFRLDTRTKRAATMISAEEAILNRGGSVIRLAGLYTVDRGPHSYWLKSGEIKGDPEGTINMLHYEDAAAVCLKALESPLRNQIYLASDDYPVSRQEICEASLASGKYPDVSMPKFLEEVGPRQKRTNCKKTRELIGWEPKYPSFQSFMYGLGGKEFKMKEKLDENTLLLGGLDDDFGDMDFEISL